VQPILRLHSASFAFGSVGFSHWLVASSSPQTQWIRSTAEWDSFDISAGLGYALGQRSSNSLQLRLGFQYSLVSKLSLFRMVKPSSSRADYPEAQGESAAGISPFLGAQWYF
jgi:hypothetical protein